MERKMSFKKIARIFVILIFLVMIAFFLFKIFNKKGSEEEKVEVIDNIESYGYSLDDNETAYYKELFNELKEILNEDSVDEKEYAKSISKLFVADFYNLDNKVSKNDVGGIQFVYEDYREDFKKYATESVYHYIKANDKKKEELPIITKVEVTDIDTETFKYGEKSDTKAYKTNVKVSYKKDLGYPSEVELILIHKDKKLEIAKMK